MNARSQIIELAMEFDQVEEAVLGIFHTILFHRSLGKFLYTSDSSYSISCLGMRDVDCETIDFTYVSCSSDALNEHLRAEIGTFCNQLRVNVESTTDVTTQISLEFYQKKPPRWFPFVGSHNEAIPWEVWTIRIEIITLPSEEQRPTFRIQLGNQLNERMLNIADIINRQDYVPKLPNQTTLNLVFDTSYPDVQPYLFKVNHNTLTSVGTTMKKLINNTFSL